MGGHTVLYRKAAGGDFTTSGGEADDWRQALDVVGGILGGGAYLVTFGHISGAGGWFVTLLPPEKSPQCPQCGGLVHVVDIMKQFWCPVCEPDGLEIDEIPF